MLQIKLMTKRLIKFSILEVRPNTINVLGVNL
jgi:hypothetical protein